MIDYVALPLNTHLFWVHLNLARLVVPFSYKCKFENSY